MASKEERDARLDTLVREVRAWATKRRAYLNSQVTSSKAILRGRTGAERLNNESISSASILLTDEIDTFLAG